VTWGDAAAIRPGGTEVTVSYDLTSPGPAANAGPGRFADGAPAFPAHRQAAIANLIKTIENP
jgi:hypothetical protein